MIERKGNRIIGDTWEEMGLQVPVSKYHSLQDVKIRTCPSCKDLGKNRSSDYSVSLIPGEGRGHCHKCGVVFLIRKERNEIKVEKSFTPPSKANLTALSPEGLKFFTNRMISQEAVNFFKVVEKEIDGTKWVAYPYFFNGELVNIKYKNTVEKSYRQSPNGMHVVHNYDEAKKHKYVIVTEGEEEDFCWFDAGFPYATSVDAGAPNPNDKIDKKLECITNCIDLYENAERIFIAVDNDDNGRRLQSELIRRFDVEKVKLVDFGKYKDANEYRMYEGIEGLAALLSEAKDVRMSGVFTVADVQERLWDMYHNGLPKGTTTHMPSIDKIWKWREGETTLVTGYANEGKSAMYDIALPVLKAVFDGWPVGLFIPENFPAEQFYEDVIHSYVGKTTDKEYPTYRMTPEEFQSAMEFVNEHFFTVYPEDDHTLDAIFKRLDYCVRKHGIRIAVIDPFNMVDNLYDGRRTYDLYVGDFMTELNRFTAKRKLHTILVAHQNKPDKKLSNGNWPAPDPYNIKGGGTFFDKATNVVSVYRPLRLTDRTNPLVEVQSHKIKWKKLLMADTGVAEVNFNWKTNRYDDPALGNKNPLDNWRSRDLCPVVETHKEEQNDDEYIDLPF